MLFSKILRTGLVTEPLSDSSDKFVEIVRKTAAEIQRHLGRNLAIREVDAGSCNGCEIEISGLTGPVYDSERFGIHFVASPRHADMLLVTGRVTQTWKCRCLRPTMRPPPRSSW